MRPGRRFPGWKRLMLEYAAMTLVYIAVVLVSGNLIFAVIAVMGTMIVGRVTRDRGEPPPSDRPR